MDLVKLWKSAKIYASKRGMRDEAEDFASEFVLRKLQGKSAKQSIPQAYKDYLDYLNAGKRKMKVPYFVVSHDPEIASLFGLNLKYLDNRERLMIDLYYTRQWTMKEIGKFFGRSESTISKWFKKMSRRAWDGG